MLHSGHEVICFYSIHFTSLGIGPFYIFTKVEGIGQSVIRYFIGFCQCRLQSSLYIVLHQSVIGIDDRIGICRTGSCKSVPCYRIARIRHGEAVF